MARYRRSYRRHHRRPRAYTWQSLVVSPQTQLTVPTGEIQKGVITVLTPGVGPLSNVRPFDAPHTLERIRGSCLHEASTSSSGTGYVAVQVAALRVPSEFANVMSSESSQDSIVDVTDNLEGDDYFLYESVFCGADVDQENVSVVDNRAKRKFDVGDVISFPYRIYNASAGNATVYFGLNLRILWRLRN